MFTKNWYILQSLNMLADEKQAETHLRGINWDGTSQYFYYYPYKRIIDVYSALNSAKTDLTSTSYGVLFGTGNTPVSLDDYTLAGDVIQNIGVLINRTYSYSAAQQVLKAVYTITNNNAEEIVIREVALTVPFYYDSGASNLSVCVIDRTVLDTPVTIPAGGIGQVEYTITFNLPTATT